MSLRIILVIFITWLHTQIIAVPIITNFNYLGIKGPLINYREKGRYRLVGGESFTPCQEGVDKVLARLKGGHNKFWGSFNMGLKVSAILKGNAKGFHPVEGRM